MPSWFAPTFGPCYSRDRHPIDYATFLRWRADIDSKILRETQAGNRRVIAAWLGRDDCSTGLANHVPRTTFALAA